MELTRRAAKDLNIEEIYQLYLKVYSDYFFPVNLDFEDFEEYLHELPLDYELSHCYYLAGEPVALALLSRNGKEAWLSAFGLITAYRSQGWGGRIWETVMEDLLAKNCQSIGLAVLDRNEKAKKFYLDRGFIQVDEFAAWSLSRRLVSTAGDKTKSMLLPLKEWPKEEAAKRRLIWSQREKSLKLSRASYLSFLQDTYIAYNSYMGSLFIPVILTSENLSYSDTQELVKQIKVFTGPGRRCVINILGSQHLLEQTALIAGFIPGERQKFLELSLI